MSVSVGEHCSKSNPYRAAIDGLRAFAVLGVLIYHAYPTLLPGGFLGVDVFFVISGFLITNHIITEEKIGQFSFSNFYRRRILRLFPSLVVVTMSVSIIGVIVLLPHELEQISKHLIGAGTFSSNFIYLKEAGYFDLNSLKKPLLHLWSLAIEEQFYFFWPLILVATFKRRLFKMGPLILAILSMVYCFRTSVADLDTAFYSPFSRFWELLCGALIAIFQTQLLRITSIQSKPLSMMTKVIPLIGLGIIMVSYVTLSSQNRLPGPLSLLVVAAAAMIIVFDDTKYYGKFILELKPIVWIGLISYPLYLWHWPLLSFHSYLSPRPLPIEIPLVLFLAFGLSILTFKFVEKPLRFHRNKILALKILTSSFLGILAFGLFGFLTKGIPLRMNYFFQEYQHYQRDLSEFENYRNKMELCSNNQQEEFKHLTWCYLGPKKAFTKRSTLIWGDSHADHFFPGIIHVDHTSDWIFMGRTGCPPVLNVQAYWKNKEGSDCLHANQEILAQIRKKNEIHTVVLAFLSPFYITDIGFSVNHRDGNSPSNFVLEHDLAKTLTKPEAFEKGFMETLSELAKLKKNVILVLDVPELPFFPDQCVKRPFQITSVDCDLAESAYESRRKIFDDILNRVISRFPNLRVYDPKKAFCQAGNCFVLRDGILLYRDGNHLSIRGSEYLAKDFLNWKSEQGLGD